MKRITDQDCNDARKIIAQHQCGQLPLTCTQRTILHVAVSERSRHALITDSQMNTLRTTLRSI